MERIHGIKAAVVGVLGCLTALWGWFGWLVVAWIGCMVLDYATGSAAALRSGEWSSKTARDGLWHKLGAMVAVLVAAILDGVIRLALEHIPALNLPFECVKIDRSFVQSSFQSRRNDLFLRSIVPCFRSLGCQIIFEGVENESLFSYARSFGSDIMIQGYCYSQPLDREKFRKKIGLDGAIQASIV